jgi:hypothetical protein
MIKVPGSLNQYVHGTGLPMAGVDQAPFLLIQVQSHVMTNRVWAITRQKIDHAFKTFWSCARNRKLWVVSILRLGVWGAWLLKKPREPPGRRRVYPAGYCFITCQFVLSS